MPKYKSRLLIALLAICTGAVVWVSMLSRSDGEALVVCSFGGSFQESQRKAFYEPFSRASGVVMREASYSGEYSKIKAMVESGQVTWDIVDVEDAVMLLGVKEGMYELIDYNTVDRRPLFDSDVNPYGVGANVYSTVLAFSTEVYPSSARQPKTWEDFWDVDRFPGPRALRNSPMCTLEFALIADGVPLDELYPLDVERAFRKLDEIKRHVTVWWTTGQQPVQLLANKEVVITSAWSGRIWNARNIAHIPLAMSWEGGLMEPEWWVVPKGSRNRDIAMRFIAFAAKPRPQAEMARLFGVGPTNREAFDYISEELMAELPTAPDNLRKHRRLGSAWWAENRSRLQEIWDKWLLEKK